MDRKTFFKKGLFMLVEPFMDALEGLGQKAAPRGLRPPGAVEETLFLKLCTRCDECIVACPQSSIRAATEGEDLPQGTPAIYPQEGPCYLCDSLYCVEACPEGALKWVEKEEIDMGIAVVDRDKCFAWRREDPSCDYCYTRCPFPDKAIRMIKNGGPVVDRDACVGCGLCEYFCVTGQKAITVVSRR
jgi:MauM/NapG family ferredoxin protein